MIAAVVRLLTLLRELESEENQVEPKQILMTLAAFCGMTGTILQASEVHTKPMLRVVLFTPADVEPPDGARLRLKEHVDYAQACFTKWMKHWGHGLWAT